MALHVGLRGSVTHTVGLMDTAVALGSGDVPVLGTPRVVALAEAATMAALAGSLDSGQTTVGTRIALDHLAATPVGRPVTAEAVLSEVDGRRLRFTVTVRDAAVSIAAGEVHRVVVDRDRFLDRSIAS